MEYNLMYELLMCNSKEQVMKLHFVVLNKDYLLVSVVENGDELQSKVMSVARARHLANWFGDMYGWDNVLI